MEFHLALGLGALHPKRDIDPSMQLVHLSTDPGNLLRKVDLVTEDFAGLRGGAERIQRAAHNAGRLLLVIEDTQQASSTGNDEDRQSVQPAAAGIRVG